MKCIQRVCLSSVLVFFVVLVASVSAQGMLIAVPAIGPELDTSIKNSLDLKISQIIEREIKKLDIPTNANFADLRRQVEKLQIALNKKPEA